MNDAWRRRKKSSSFYFIYIIFLSVLFYVIIFYSVFFLCCSWLIVAVMRGKRGPGSNNNYKKYKHMKDCFAIHPAFFVLYFFFRLHQIWRFANPFFCPLVSTTAAERRTRQLGTNNSSSDTEQKMRKEENLAEIVTATTAAVAKSDESLFPSYVDSSRHAVVLYRR